MHAGNGILAAVFCSTQCATLFDVIGGNNGNSSGSSDTNGSGTAVQ
jgi:hypothetical protein